MLTEKTCVERNMLYSSLPWIDIFQMHLEKMRNQNFMYIFITVYYKIVSRNWEFIQDIVAGVV